MTTLHSPPIEVSQKFSYVLEAYLKTEKLQYDEAYYTVTLYDSNKVPLETYESTRQRSASDWRKVRIGPLIPRSKNAHLAVIGLHLRPTSKADLKGAVLFDDIWFARLPRMTLSTNSEHNVYTESKEVEITCEVSGILERDPMMNFELIDIGQKQLERWQQNLEGQVLDLWKSRLSKVQDEQVVRSKDGNYGYSGVMKWKPKLKSNGFYKVRVTMVGKKGKMDQRSISLAVIRPLPQPTGGEFGWALPHGEDPLPLEALAGLLGQVGINWVKFPVWYSEKENERAERLA